MKNETLDELTELANEVHETIPDVLVRGDGKFYAMNGSPVPATELLSMCYRARERAAKLYNMLENEPRRRVTGGGNGS